MLFLQGAKFVKDTSLIYTNYQKKIVVALAVTPADPWPHSDVQEIY